MEDTTLHHRLGEHAVTYQLGGLWVYATVLCNLGGGVWSAGVKKRRGHPLGGKPERITVTTPTGTPANEQTLIGKQRVWQLAQTWLHRHARMICRGHGHGTVIVGARPWRTPEENWGRFCHPSWEIVDGQVHPWKKGAIPAGQLKTLPLVRCNMADKSSGDSSALATFLATVATTCGITNANVAAIGAISPRGIVTEVKHLEEKLAGVRDLNIPYVFTPKTKVKPIDGTTIVSVTRPKDAAIAMLEALTKND